MSIRLLSLTTTAVLLAVTLSGCTQSGGGGEGASDRVVIETDFGDIILALEVDKAPATVANFLKYVDEDFYDETLFHRIVEDFMIQGGGMGTDGQFKTPTHPSVKNEAASSGLKNVRYSVAMARTSDPDSATTQFFINHADNTFLDPSGNSAGYAVFAHVVDGEDVVDAIAGVPVEAYQGRPDQHCQGDSQPSCPKEDVVIRSIRRAQGGDEASPAVVPDEQKPVVRVPCESAEDASTAADIQLSGELQAGLITPGVWNLCGHEERMLLWVHNGRDVAVDVALNATIDGDLPGAGGWGLTFEDATLHLEPLESRAGRAYTDWGWTVLHLTVPEGATGEHDLVVRVGDVEVAATLVVAPALDVTADRGDSATVTFDGDFAASGEGFWEGTIPGIDVGSGGLVTGVDLGLLGLGYQETASLIVPPALAYGYDNPAGSGYEQFNGQWLRFTVTLDAF